MTTPRDTLTCPCRARLGVTFRRADGGLCASVRLLNPSAVLTPEGMVLRGACWKCGRSLEFSACEVLLRELLEPTIDMCRAR